MPELPEVQTTVDGLNRTVIGKTIKDVWSTYHIGKKQKEETLRSPAFFSFFKKKLKGAVIENVTRRGKNILIHTRSEFIVLIHMKMTGHFLFGEYRKSGDMWAPKEKESPLGNPFSRHIRFVISFSDDTHLALSDMRTFAKITLIKKDEIETTPHLAALGPEILTPLFTKEIFITNLQKRPALPIKTALLDQSLFVGIGNIYSDELLWLAGIHPERPVLSLSPQELSTLFPHLKPVLQKGIDFKGDSTSDYRTIDGTPGKFHLNRNAYRKTGTVCNKKGCSGMIVRTVVRGRSAHYCNQHQL